MKPTNLVILLGSAILGGLYLTNKKAKDKAKADADALILASALTTAQPPTTSALDSTIKDKQAILTSEEATIFATRTIAEVSSLMLKYPLMAKEEFIADRTKDMSSKVGFVDAIAQTQRLEILRQQTLNETLRAEKDYQTMLAVRNTWKSQFSTVYKDLKNYFSTLTKEQADSVIKFLPKMTLMFFVDDHDPRLKDFWSEKEQMDLIDSNLDTESLTQKAFPEYLRLIQSMWDSNKSAMWSGGGQGFATAVLMAEKR